ncbi:MAG TPA: prenyltransferase/squalene oxidase repeat-containing protein [Tepidisphaeraceae bacterium]|jgi:prenyltransferase beta subunit|nr:prenyltransferase/squalene oxidase repeat-containing protein [Tepidisphaeraceae bacterium]
MWKLWKETTRPRDDQTKCARDFTSPLGLFVSSSLLALLCLASAALADPPNAPPPAHRSDQPLSEITPQQQAAVEKGLEYLASRQNNEGSFGNSGAYGATAAITALSGIAFMADGNLPGRGKYGEVVRKAVNFICRNQQESGLFTTNASQGEMYSHGFATLFIGEAYGMNGDDQIKENLQRAVRLIERCQNSEGGWRYQPAPVDADISVTICQIMALRSARDAGIKTDAGVMDRALAYVKRCQNPDGGFSYQATGGESGFARTAAGTASLYYAGKFEDNGVTRGLDYLSRFIPGRDQVDEQGHFFYGQYYAVQAMFLAGGKYWKEWYPAIRDLLVARQNRVVGNWEGEVDPDYCTAMALIILQMPNRYLPVFNGKGPGS